MNKFDWKRLRDCMMEYDQNEAPEYVYEVLDEIIKEKKINLRDFTYDEIKKIIDIGINTLIDFHGGDFENVACFDYILKVGLLKKLYEKYPEVKKKWNDAIWVWEDDDWEVCE